MNLVECADHVEATLAALRSGFDVSRLDGECRILTPFHRRDGDQLEVYIRIEGDRIKVSDDGATLDYLDLSGVRTQRNRAFNRLVEETSRAHEVTLDQGEIVAYAESLEDTGNSLLQVVAAMNDLAAFELTRREREPATFVSQVAGELVGLGVRYERDVELAGLALPQKFTFLIDSGRDLLLEPLQAKDSTRATSKANGLIVAVLDVQKISPQYSAAAVLDDSRDIWQQGAIPELEGFGITVVRWSQRHWVLRELLSSQRLP